MTSIDVLTLFPGLFLELAFQLPHGLGIRWSAISHEVNAVWNQPNPLRRHVEVTPEMLAHRFADRNRQRPHTRP